MFVPLEGCDKKAYVQRNLCGAEYIALAIQFPQSDLITRSSIRALRVDPENRHHHLLEIK